MGIRSGAIRNKSPFRFFTHRGVQKMIANKAEASANAANKKNQSRGDHWSENAGSGALLLGLL
jgi:hypothetical protein